jgi:hypothetical protein
MSTYYRKRFSKLNSYQKNLTNKKSITEFEGVAKTFMKLEFGNAVDVISKQEFKDLYKSLLGIIFSHRYKKNDKFLDGVDFGIVRDVLYNYTTEG